MERKDQNETEMKRKKLIKRTLTWLCEETVSR